VALLAERSQLTHAAETALDEAFRRPPASAGPYTWWHWMNGNVTADGITPDLEAMKRVGVAGFQLFEVSDGIIPGRIAYGSPQHLRLPPNLGAPAEVTLPELVSLHKHSDAGVKYFSGTATYTEQFNVAANATANGKRLYLDLGRVEVLAEVRLNGKDLGILWKPPYRVDITDAVHSGNNLLEVRATNLWPNRLIGDEQLPPENEYAQAGEDMGLWLREGAIKRMPDWYLQGKPKPPGGRITFTTWQHFTKESPLLESGLIGPVRLRTAVRRAVAA
jgi:hypothetical protein